MRENCTYGSMRGRAYPITRGVPLYSTPLRLPLEASLALVLGLGALLLRTAGAGAPAPLTPQAIALIGEEADDDYDAVVPGDAAAACNSLQA